ncbi:MAG: ABC transporter ATP-binding protein [Clostridiales bacterium]|nr:ABC transporter ATP-binding protein [Clostridiales bacterium]
MPLLQVNNLRVSFRTRKGRLCAVHDLSFSLEAGKTLALVGESGSGKSVSAMSILRLLEKNGRIESGEILFQDGEKTIDLAALPIEKMYGVRGNRISVIFQEPMTALNPVLSVGKQLSEPFLFHRKLSKKHAVFEAEKMLEAVQITSPKRVLKQYAHQLSGGMRQRVMIAMALACQPKILIADEPTTALDVTIQAQILRLMQDLQKKQGTAILFITHDLGVVNEMADDVAVMYCGKIVERVPAYGIFGVRLYSHPYTEGLIASLPSQKKRRLETIVGNVPHPLQLPKGCKFAPRCKYRTKKCVEEEPALLDVEEGHAIRCHYPKKEERESAGHANLVIDYPS